MGSTCEPPPTRSYCLPLAVTTRVGRQVPTPLPAPRMRLFSIRTARCRMPGAGPTAGADANPNAPDATPLPDAVNADAQPFYSTCDSDAGAPESPSSSRARRRRRAGPIVASDGAGTTLTVWNVSATRSQATHLNWAKIQNGAVVASGDLGNTNFTDLRPGHQAPLLRRPLHALQPLRLPELAVRLRRDLDVDADLRASTRRSSPSPARTSPA